VERFSRWARSVRAMSNANRRGHRGCRYFGVRAKRVVSIPARGRALGTLVSRNGLHFIPRFALDDAPTVDELIILGRHACSYPDPELAQWALPAPCRGRCRRPR
jgi:hypothetical protein